MLAWFKSYLSDREQRVIIDGQSSEWTSVEAGVPQGCVLGLGLLFLIYINDITQNIKLDCYLYADDTSLSDVVEDPALSFSKLLDDLNSIKEWALKWLVTINTSKTKCTFSDFFCETQ